MRLARWQDLDGTEWVGPLADGAVTPVKRIGRGREGDRALLAMAVAGTTPRPLDDPVPVGAVRLLAPIRRPGAIRDFMAFEAHVATARARRGLAMDPDWYDLPVSYFTSPHVILGPDDLVPVPATEQLDYELEVGIVVGRDLRDADAEAALDAIAGYLVYDDFSARDLQAREMRQGLGPSKGKDFAQGLGPVLVTPDELRGTRAWPAARMVARVNGVEYSRGDLADLHHPVGALLAAASAGSLVRAGDVIGTGTVGTGCILELSAVHGAGAYPWLAAGDVVECEVEGIGVLRNVIGERGPRELVRPGGPDGTMPVIDQ